MYKYERSFFFPAPADVVFKYHACMDNIAQILPKHLSIKNLGTLCDVKMRDKIKLKISMYVFSFYWEAEIIEYKPFDHFIDLLNKGPFSYWKHYHFFESKDNGTMLTDRIEYDLPLGVIGKFANYVFVRKELEKIFSRRHESALIFFNKIKQIP